MASQDGSVQAPAQAQMRRESNDGSVDQPSNIHGQTNFLQETGENVKTMAQGVADIGKGAADIGKGAVFGAVSLARGAAMGTANVAQGAADAVKNTFGGSTIQTSKSDSHNHATETDRS